MRLELELIPRDFERSDERVLRAPVVRRVLGAALIERHCPYSKPPCRASSPKGTQAARRQALRVSCPQATSCPYGVLFAASRTDRPTFALFVPPLVDETPVERLEVTLLGPACECVFEVVRALCRALELGLGRQRRAFALWRVLRLDGAGGREPLCGADPAELPAAIEPELLAEPALDPDASGAVELRLASPLRIKRDGRLLKGDGPLTLEELAGRILERWDAVVEAESPPPALNRDTFVAAASAAELLEYELRWVEERDWSAARRQQLRLGGKVGWLVWSERAAPLLPLLRAGEVLHAGKNVTSGFGRLAATPLPSS